MRNIATLRKLARAVLGDNFTENEEFTKANGFDSGPYPALFVQTPSGNEIRFSFSHDDNIEVESLGSADEDGCAEVCGVFPSPAAQAIKQLFEKRNVR